MKRNSHAVEFRLCRDATNPPTIPKLIGTTTSGGLTFARLWNEGTLTSVIAAVIATPVVSASPRSAQRHGTATQHPLLALAHSGKSVSTPTAYVAGAHHPSSRGVAFPRHRRVIVPKEAPIPESGQSRVTDVM